MNRVNPFDKIYYACNHKNKYTDYENIEKFPRYIDVELTNVCNYNCLMCPVGTNSIKRKTGFMSIEIYEKFLNEIKQHKTPIRFIRWGEPTLHKHFIKFVKMAKEEGIKCHLNTNGSLLNKSLFEELINLELDSIKFSFQGVDRKSYLEMRNKDYFDQLLDKIKLLYELRGGREYPFIHVATTITYETAEQINKFKNEIKKYTDKLTIGRTKLEHINVDNVRLDEKDKKRLMELKNKETLVKVHPKCCPEVFDKLSINWDGTVSACCADYDNKMLIGDIKNDKLINIWNSNKMNEYRKILSKNEYDKLELCSKCYDYMEIQQLHKQKIK